MRLLCSTPDMGCDDIMESLIQMPLVHGQTEPLNLPDGENNHIGDLVANFDSLNDTLSASNIEEAQQPSSSVHMMHPARIA